VRFASRSVVVVTASSMTLLQLAVSLIKAANSAVGDTFSRPLPFNVGPESAWATSRNCSQFTFAARRYSDSFRGSRSKSQSVRCRMSIRGQPVHLAPKCQDRRTGLAQ